VIAHYAGDGTYGASNSTSPISVTVNPEGSTATVTVEPYNPSGNLISSLSPVPYGDFAYVRVDVVGTTSGQESATGIVTLTDNGVAIVNPVGATTLTFPLNTEGYLEDQTAYLAVGSHSFQAKYSGDASYTGSTSSAVALTVTQGATATTVTPSATVVTSSQNVTLTAFVDTLSGGLAPSGAVTFYNNGTSIGTISGNQLVTTLDTNGFVAAQGSLTTQLAASGSITAKYLGDTNYTGSTSTGVAVTVNTPGLNLSPRSNTVTDTITSPGQSTTQLITVTGANGFAGSVILSYAVTGEPAGAVDLPTCSFGAPDLNFAAPNTITLTATSETGNATMTCASTAASGALFKPSNRPFGRDWPLAAAAVSLFCFFFLLGIPKQRRWGFAPLAVLLVVLVAAGVGCGGGSGGSTGVTNPGTTIGAYTITVTATPSIGSATSSVITVNVQ
jgi:hypothetical protein